MFNLFRRVKADATAPTSSALSFPSNSTRFDPYKSFKYTVDIQWGASTKKTFAKAGFQKCSGLKMKTDTIEYREGGDSLTVIKTPGLVKYDPITLERGMSQDADMWDWAVASTGQADGSMRGSMIVTLQDRDGSKARQWNVLACWVSDYETGDFDALANSIAIERIVVQHEGFVKAL